MKKLLLLVALLPQALFGTALPVTANEDGTLKALTNGVKVQITAENLTGIPGLGITIAGTPNEITANTIGSAVTVSLPNALTFTSKVVTGGTFNGVILNGSLGSVTPSTVVGTTGTFSGLVIGSAYNSTSSGTLFSGVNATGSKTNGALGNSNGELDWGVLASGVTYIGSTTADDLRIDVAGTQVGLFKSTGFNGVIGGTTPAQGTFSNVNLTTGQITTAPTTGNDLTNKTYVDALAATGLKPKANVTTATTANITLSGEQTIAGVLTSASRILVKDQTSTLQNGPYVTAAGAWTRATDGDTAGELLVNNYYFVENPSSTNYNKGYVIQTAPTVLNTDPVLFSQFSGSQTYTNGGNLSLVGNQFNLASTITSVTLTSSAFNGTIGATTPSTIAAITGSFSGQLTSTVSTGSSPFVVASTTQVNNLNAALLGGATFASPTSIGSGTPSSIVGTTFNSNSNANIRTTKNNFHTIINVKDYASPGEIFNGSVDNTATINAAIAAVTNFSTLLFENGNFLFTSALTSFTGLTGVRIEGRGARITNNTGASGGNTFVIDNTCADFEVCGLVFIGTASVRANGIHIRMASNNSTIHDNYFATCSDFGVLVSAGNATQVVNVRVSNNQFVATKGDGLHFGSAAYCSATNNIFYGTGDDSIGVIADYASYPPYSITLANNQINQAGSCGIRVNEGTDIGLFGNQIRGSVEAAIEVARYTSTTAYNNRITIKNNKIYGSTTTSGPRGAINMYFCNESTVTDNDIYDTVNGAAIALLDFNDLSIKGNIIRGTGLRGIVTDDTTTTNVATNWYGLIISGNIFQYISANEAIYIDPPSGITLNNMLITNNTGNQMPAGAWISYQQVTTGKVINNIARDSQTISPGGFVSGVTNTPNY